MTPTTDRNDGSPWEAWNDQERHQACGHCLGRDRRGIERNGAYTVRAAVASPFGPGWAWALIGLALLMWGWRRENG